MSISMEEFDHIIFEFETIWKKFFTNPCERTKIDLMNYLRLNDDFIMAVVQMAESADACREGILIDLGHLEEGKYDQDCMNCIFKQLEDMTQEMFAYANCDI